MSSTKRNIIVLAIVAILLGVAIYFIYPPSSSTRLGLDLQGGLAVLLEAKDTEKAPRTDEGLRQAVNIIGERINKLGVTEPEIQRQGEWKVSIQLPGIDNPEQALALIGKTAVLAFYNVNEQFGTPYASEEEALTVAGVASVDELPVGANIISWPGQEGSDRTDSWFLVDTAPLLTGSDLAKAGVDFDQNNQPKVDMEFKPEGAQKFADVTDTMAKTAQLTNQTQLLAIVLDNKVESAPRVSERIDGGNAEITGSFTLDEAKQLALVLQTGALPVELQVIDQRSVGATLGKASLRQALIAGLIGFVLVLIFMVAYYRLLGLIADLALIIYGVLLWGLLNAIGATLTLPGIAGIVLTLGMAVDANVIIFARVREEVQAGKTLRTAVAAGFKKGIRAIVDANVTTLITAVVLFFTATGGVRGFALTLGIGILLSMVTAILVTRSLLELLAGTHLFRNLSFLGVKTHTEKTA